MKSIIFSNNDDKSYNDILNDTINISEEMNEYLTDQAFLQEFSIIDNQIVKNNRYGVGNCSNLLSVESLQNFQLFDEIESKKSACTKEISNLSHTYKFNYLETCETSNKLSKNNLDDQQIDFDNILKNDSIDDNLEFLCSKLDLFRSYLFDITIQYNGFSQIIQVYDDDSLKSLTDQFKKIIDQDKLQIKVIRALRNHWFQLQNNIDTHSLFVQGVIENMINNKCILNELEQSQKDIGGILDNLQQNSMRKIQLYSLQNKRNKPAQFQNIINDSNKQNIIKHFNIIPQNNDILQQFLESITNNKQKKRRKSVVELNQKQYINPQKHPKQYRSLSMMSNDEKIYMMSKKLKKFSQINEYQDKKTQCQKLPIILRENFYQNQNKKKFSKDLNQIYKNSKQKQLQMNFEYSNLKIIQSNQKFEKQLNQYLK